MTIDEVQNKIQNINECDDLETSLTLAAEAGNALLAENSKLRQELYDITLRNSRLHQDNSVEKYRTELEIAHNRIEKLECENEYISNKNLSLLEKLEEVEHQLLKEKELRATLMQTVEIQDREKENAICASEKEIKALKVEIKKLKEQKVDKDHEPTRLIRTTKTIETQTCNYEATSQNTSITLLCELAQLKLRQNDLEHLVEGIQKKLGDHGNGKKLSILPESLQNTSSFRRTLQPSSKNICKSEKKTGRPQRNHFSVSLQVAKNKAFLDSAGFITSTKEDVIASRPNNVKKTIESANVQKIKSCKRSNQTHPNIESPKHFLELRQLKENKQKFYRSRIIINSKLKAG